MAPPAVPYRTPLFPPTYKSQRVLHLGFSCQVAGGGGVLSFPNGELVGDCSGGFSKNVLLLEQRNQILLARTGNTYVHVGSEVPLGKFFSTGIL